MNIETLTLNGKQVGSIIDGTIYVSRRRESKHLFRGGANSPAEAFRKGTASWGVDREVLDLLVSKGVQVVAIEDNEAKRVYWASLGRFLSGRILNMKHGVQHFLPTQDMGQVGNLNTLLAAVEQAVSRC